MYIYGRNPLINRLDQHLPIKRVFILPFHDLLPTITKKKIPYQIVDKHKLNSLTNHALHQGIVAEIDNYKYYSIEHFLSNPSNKNSLVLMLDGIEDPHNFGAIIRTAETIGVDAIIIGSNRCVEVTPVVYKVSTGAVDNVKIIKVNNLTNCIKRFKKANFWVVTLDMDGQNYTSVDYNMNVLLVVGSEGNGVSRLVKENSDFIVRLPIKGKTSSLNASVAAGVMLYHIENSRN